MPVLSPLPLLKNWWRASPREVVLVAITLVLVGRAAWVLRRAVLPPEPAAATAKRWLQQLLDGDGESLYDKVMPTDVDLDPLDRSHYDGLVDWVQHSFKGYSRTGPLQSELTPIGAYAFCYMRDEKGNEIAPTINIVETQDGPKFYPLPLVLAALTARYGDIYVGKSDGIRIHSALRDGFASDQTILDSFCRGMCLTDPDRADFRTWSQDAEAQSRTVERIEQEQVESRAAASR